MKTLVMFFVSFLAIANIACAQYPTTDRFVARTAQQHASFQQILEFAYTEIFKTEHDDFRKAAKNYKRFFDASSKGHVALKSYSHLKKRINLFSTDDILLYDVIYVIPGNNITIASPEVALSDDGEAMFYNAVIDNGNLSIPATIEAAFNGNPNVMAYSYNFETTDPIQLPFEKWLLEESSGSIQFSPSGWVLRLANATLASRPDGRGLLYEGYGLLSDGDLECYDYAQDDPTVAVNTGMTPLDMLNRVDIPLDNDNGVTFCELARGERIPGKEFQIVIDENILGMAQINGRLTLDKNLVEGNGRIAIGTDEINVAAFGRLGYNGITNTVHCKGGIEANNIIRGMSAKGSAALEVNFDQKFARATIKGDLLFDIKALSASYKQYASESDGSIEHFDPKNLMMSQDIALFFIKKMNNAKEILLNQSEFKTNARVALETGAGEGLLPYLRYDFETNEHLGDSLKGAK